MRSRFVFTPVRVPDIRSVPPSRIRPPQFSPCCRSNRPPALIVTFVVCGKSALPGAPKVNRPPSLITIDVALRSPPWPRSSRASSPPFTTTVPVKPVLLARIVNSPGPVFTNVPAPESVPE